MTTVVLQFGISVTMPIKDEPSLYSKGWIVPVRRMYLDAQSPCITGLTVSCAINVKMDWLRLTHSKSLLAMTLSPKCTPGRYLGWWCSVFTISMRERPCVGGGASAKSPSIVTGKLGSLGCKLEACGFYSASKKL
eukprot:1158299-Pelagomonas_calceolata.AAC.10